MTFNLPDGVSLAEINGPPEPRCEFCGEPYSDYWDAEVKKCPDCEEIIPDDDEA